MNPKDTTQASGIMSSLRLGVSARFPFGVRERIFPTGFQSRKHPICSRVHERNALRAALVQKGLGKMRGGKCVFFEVFDEVLAEIFLLETVKQKTSGFPGSNANGRSGGLEKWETQTVANLRVAPGRKKGRLESSVGLEAAISSLYEFVPSQFGEADGKELGHPRAAARNRRVRTRIARLWREVMK